MPEKERARSSDEAILTHLGSAVLLCWDKLPVKAQLKILDQANDIIGLPPIPDVRRQIVELLSRRGKI
jgi:hypothetical protein